MQSSPPLSYEAFQQRRYVPALDGLRALAILGVLLHHTSGPTFDPFQGYRGVWVFFVLSGFLITTLALREEARRGRLNIAAFMVRRVFRILPLYYLTLAAYLVCTFVLGMGDNADRFRDYLLNYFFYVPELPIFKYDFVIPFAQTWSLGIEEKFYLVWPLLAFGFLAGSRHRIAATLALLATTATLTSLNTWLAQMWGSYTDILIGCLVAQLLHRRAVYEMLSVVGRTGYAWATIAVLGIATVTPGIGMQIGERVYSLVAAIALIALVTNERGPAQVAGHGWLVAIGRWSYAIYLTHTLVIEAVKPLIPWGSVVGDFETLAVYVLIDFPFCWLLHTYFEKPLIAFGRKLVAPRQVAVAVASD